MKYGLIKIGIGRKMKFTNREVKNVHESKCIHLKYQGQQLNSHLYEIVTFPAGKKHMIEFLKECWLEEYGSTLSDNQFFCMYPELK